MLIEYILVFVAGMVGSFHCIGMCGGFPIAIASVSKGSATRKISSHLLYNFGRIFTYTFLGAAFGSFSLMINEMQTIFSGQVIVSVIAGVFMVLIGLQILGILNEKTIPGPTPFYMFLKKAMASLIGYKSLAAPFYLGIFNGFLPCPLIYAFLFKATASGSPDKGALTMLSLGLGTIPTMLLLGNLGEILSPRFKASISRVPGLVIVIFGIITLARAFLPYVSELGYKGHFSH
ncbi:MAG: sulfite exporter TauE/SafE family protein [Deltaproteobacteria bacterium]|nr:sulfite exporter TauE/SafE family protein [Deltaproteobacteria bacterium]